MWIYGLNPVLEALRAGRDIERMREEDKKISKEIASIRKDIGDRVKCII